MNLKSGHFLICFSLSECEIFKIQIDIIEVSAAVVNKTCQNLRWTSSCPNDRKLCEAIRVQYSKV